MWYKRLDPHSLFAMIADMRYTSILTLVALSAVLAGCGGREAKAVPRVSGDRLDVAKETLDDAGLGYEVIGGGAFGVVVDSHWQVCEQHPRAGRSSSSVELIVARSCPQTFPRRGVPDVVGLRLDAAEAELGRRGLEYYVSSEDKVIIRSNWTVCDQSPAPGGRADDVEVELYVDRFDCDWEDDDD
jgi:beta-lactam-binding protein with PASTA domain